MRVICIGECMVELRAVAADTFARSYAGDVYNTAVYLKRSLPDADVQFLTVTGDDAMSRAMREAWRAHQIDDSLAFTMSGGSPGLYLIETDALGERRFHYWRHNSAAKHWLTILREHGESHLWGADIVYLSGITLAILSEAERTAAVEWLGRLRSRVGRIAFDPNMRVALWSTRHDAAPIMRAAMRTCAIALPSTEDLQILFDTGDPTLQLDLLQTLGVREVALTLGANGCAIADGAVRTQLPAPTVEIVTDTSGAGDAFNGAYLAARLLGSSPLQAAQTGLNIAARVVTHSGAIVPESVSHPPAP
jgi:2-dehydro-3-deoxygluconokinase